MMNFFYTAGTKDGAIKKGQLEAENISNAAELIRNRGWYILSLRKSHQIGSIDFDDIKKRFEYSFGSEMSASERLMFTTHLSSMLKTGVPIVDAISTFIDASGGGRRRRMFEQIIKDLESGVPLSQAMAKFPKTFTPTFTNIVSSGESIGTLGETLAYLGDQLKRDHDLASRVRSALMYPVIIMVIMVIVIGFITFAVVPKLLTFAQSAGTQLPMATQILINMTNFVTKYGILLLIGLIVVGIFGLRLIRTTTGKLKFDTILLHTPLFGEMTRKFNLARFCRLLGAFYHYGIPLTTSFSILKNSLPNMMYQQAIARLEDRMAHGMSLSDGLEAEPPRLYPRILVRVVRSAEKTATVDDTLWRLADYYETELDAVLKNLTTIIEPVMILILGVAVVGLAMAVVVPIYQITTSIK